MRKKRWRVYKRNRLWWVVGETKEGSFTKPVIISRQYERAIHLLYDRIRRYKNRSRK